MSRCDSCFAEIIWLRTTNGKQMPCDPAVVTVVTAAGKTIRGYIPHWATCPHADQHRKKEKP